MLSQSALELIDECCLVDDLRILYCQLLSKMKRFLGGGCQLIPEGAHLRVKLCVSQNLLIESFLQALQLLALLTLQRLVLLNLGSQLGERLLGLEVTALKGSCSYEHQSSARR